MTAKDFRKARVAFGLSTTDAARFLGLTKRTVERYESETATTATPVPVATEMLLRLMERYKLRPDAVASSFRD